MNKSDQKSATDNRANQLNPQHPAYHQSRGAPAPEAEQQAQAERAGGAQTSDPPASDSTAPSEAESK